MVVSKVGRELYNKFFRGYTRKQWGLDPSELDASVTARVPTRTNRDDRYFTDTYQAMPLHGYTRMFERMLAHPNIKVMLNTDYREIAALLPWQHMVYTGPIDAFFDYRHGKLPYRSLEFRHETLAQEQFQPVGTVNFPNDFAYTRVSEFKHLTGQQHHATSVVYEYPRAEGDPYYPVPRPGEHRAVPPVRGRRGGARTTSASSAGWRPTSTTTWTRSSARRWPRSSASPPRSRPSAPVRGPRPARPRSLWPRSTLACAHLPTAPASSSRRCASMPPRPIAKARFPTHSIDLLRDARPALGRRCRPSAAANRSATRDVPASCSRRSPWSAAATSSSGGCSKVTSTRSS